MNKKIQIFLDFIHLKFYLNNFKHFLYLTFVALICKIRKNILNYLNLDKFKFTNNFLILSN